MHNPALTSQTSTRATLSSLTLVNSSHSQTSVSLNAPAWKSSLRKWLVSQGRPATLSMASKTIPLAPSKDGWSLLPYFKRVFKSMKRLLSHPVHTHTAQMCADTSTQVTPASQQPTLTWDTRTLKRDEHPSGLWAWRFWDKLKPPQAGSHRSPHLAGRNWPLRKLGVAGVPPST